MKEKKKTKYVIAGIFIILAVVTTLIIILTINANAETTQTSATIMTMINEKRLVEMIAVLSMGTDTNTNVNKDTVASELDKYLGSGKTTVVQDDAANVIIVTFLDSGREYEINISTGSVLFSFAVAFDPNGGTVSPTTKRVQVGEKYGTLPTPTKAGNTFLGWFTDLSEGEQITEDSVFDSEGGITLYAHWSVNSYYLDVNGKLDGNTSGSLGVYGTFDVYINDSLVANDVNDYYQTVPYGSTYEIKDIKATSGHKYNGVSSGSLTGTIGTSGANVRLSFSTSTTTKTLTATSGNGTTGTSSTISTDGGTVSYTCSWSSHAWNAFSGELRIQGSNDGSNWTNLRTADTGSTTASGDLYNTGNSLSGSFSGTFSGYRYYRVQAYTGSWGAYKADSSVSVTFTYVPQ